MLRTEFADPNHHWECTDIEPEDIRDNWRLLLTGLVAKPVVISISKVFIKWQKWVQKLSIEI